MLLYFFILFCFPSLVSTDLYYCSLSLLFRFIAYHCSFFCSSILIMKNIFIFNLSIFCHYALQLLYIHCIIFVISGNIYFCLYYNLLFDVHASHMHSILMVVLFLAYVSFNCSLFVLIPFLFLVLG